jgi:BirA family transcriptional regulator, biotin operon repressor / biotin---[acetyl-CoA-carboxylase] ligase
LIPRLPAQISLVALDAVDGTNAEARRRAEQGAPHLTLVWAQEQLAGRGRRGRAWASPRGNLYATLLLRPRVPIALWGQLSFVDAVALRQALVAHLPELDARLRLKWPNDLLLDGRKLSGTLLEASGADWVLIGTGVNLASHPQGTETPATSLAAHGLTLAPEVLLPTYAEAQLAWFERWQVEGFAPVRARWLEHAIGLGGAVTVRLADKTFAGRFSALDESGALLLEQGSELRRIEAGEVFLPAA